MSILLKAREFPSRFFHEKADTYISHFSMTFSINAETENEICSNEKMKYAFYNIDHSIYSCKSMREYEKVRESMRVATPSYYCI